MASCGPPGVPAGRVLACLSPAEGAALHWNRGSAASRSSPCPRFLSLDLATVHPVAEVAALRQHREWADRRMAQLIRRVGDAERPVREEAARLQSEVQALRVSACMLEVVCLLKTRC